MSSIYSIGGIEMKRTVNKLMSLLLVFIFVFSSTMAVHASSPVQESISPEHVAEEMLEYISSNTIIRRPREITMNDIMALEAYIGVGGNGLFYVDVQAAINNGVSLYLINSLLFRLNYLNDQAAANLITINSDLSFDSAETTNCNWDYSFNQITPFSSRPPGGFRCGRAWCRGGYTTNSLGHWWGTSYYLCYAETHNFSHFFQTGGIILGVGGVIAGGVAGGVSGAYFVLLGARASANNHGRGVHFSITWVGVFSFSPQ